MAPSFSEGHALMYDELNLKSEDKVLEVGVGTGISLKYYPANVVVDAIDASEPMLKEAQENIEEGVGADIRLQCMDAHHLEFDDNSFDCDDENLLGVTETDDLDFMFEFFTAYTFSKARKGMRGRVSSTVGAMIQIPISNNYK